MKKSNKNGVVHYRSFVAKDVDLPGLQQHVCVRMGCAFVALFRFQFGQLGVVCGASWRFRFGVHGGVSVHYDARLNLVRRPWHVLWAFKVDRDKYFSEDLGSASPSRAGPWEPILLFFFLPPFQLAASYRLSSSTLVAVKAHQQPRCKLFPL